jgi:hypothetical protein
MLEECAILKKRITLNLLILFLRESYAMGLGGGGMVWNERAVAEFVRIIEKVVVRWRAIFDPVLYDVFLIISNSTNIMFLNIIHRPVFI